jgi:CBS domain-containing protein
MRVHDVLRRKGGEVITVRPEATVRELLGMLSEHRIGALVVSVDGKAVEGIVSERDVVRRLHDRGTEVLDAPVSEIMTSDVSTVGPDELLENLMGLMTVNRFRHVPVVAHGALAGIVSIGDVVKHRMDELQSERDQLVGYISR